MDINLVKCSNKKNQIRCNIDPIIPHQTATIKFHTIIAPEIHFRAVDNDVCVVADDLVGVACPGEVFDPEAPFPVALAVAVVVTDPAFAVHHPCPSADTADHKADPTDDGPRE